MSEIVGSVMYAFAVLIATASGYRYSNALLAVAFSLVLVGAVLRLDGPISGPSPAGISTAGSNARRAGTFLIGFGLLGEFAALAARGSLFAGALTLVVVGVLVRFEAVMVDRRRS